MDSLKSALKVLVFASVIAVVVFFAAGLFPKRYRSVQTLYFPLQQQSSGLAALAGATGTGDAALASALGGAFGTPLVASAAPAATGILTSRTAFNDVVKRLDLATRWKLSPREAASRVDDAVTVRTDRNNFLRIEVVEENPDLAVEINNALFQHLEARASDLTLNVSAGNRKAIERAIVDNEKRLASKRSDLQALFGQRPVGRFEDESQAFVTVRRSYDDAIVQAAAARERLESAETAVRSILEKGDEVNALSAGAAQPDARSAVQDAAFGNLAQELQKRRLALLDATAKFQPDTPEYRAARRDSENAERAAREAVAGQRTALGQGLSPAFVAAKAELASLEAAVFSTGKLVRRYQSQLRNAPLVDEAFANYQALIDVKVMLTKELERAKLSETSDPSRFEQVDKPERDERPVSPRRLLMAAMAFAAAFAIGLVPEVARRSRRSTGAS